MRIARPWLLIRINHLPSSRIGHFLGNTELYLCERDAGINVPKGRYVDIFYFEKQISNQQVAKMWKRVLHIRPRWLLEPMHSINQWLPSGEIHEVGDNTRNARDVNNLLDRFDTHLRFSEEEEAIGKANLRKMGVPENASFVCLIVRDDAYLKKHMPDYDWSYHSYRDSEIKNYIMVAEMLANRGYFVVRMGAEVKEKMNIKHPRVIDYACNGIRTDFMDVYLGAKCFFCISTGLGWDAIPEMFRRPIVYVNFMPVGCLNTFRKRSLSLTKHHICMKENRKLTLSEIFDRNVAFSTHSKEYDSRNVRFEENTPKEICDIVAEMVERLNDTWISDQNNESLQKKFWEIYSDRIKNFQNKKLHGKFLSSIGASFLKENIDWLQ